jgi:hypothetical protein
MQPLWRRCIPIKTRISFLTGLCAIGVYTTEQLARNEAEAQSSVATATANTMADVPFPENIPAAASVLIVGEALLLTQPLPVVPCCLTAR